MNIKELGQLVGLVAMGDNRIVDVNILLYWEQVLPETMTLELGKQAVLQHRRHSTEYLQPAHIIAIAADLRREQRERQARHLHLEPVDSPFVSLAEANLDAKSRAFLEQLYAKDLAKRSKRSRPTKIAETEPEVEAPDAEPGV